jgi:mono/diheme cytochrome c family protein
LTRRNVTGREANVRERILEGSGGMPAFKYALDAGTIEAIVAYLKKVERFP